MYKVKTHISNSGSSREIDIVSEKYPSMKSRAHLLLLRTRYRKLDDDYFLTKSDKEYNQYIFNRDFARSYKKKYSSITCAYCGAENLIIAEKRNIPKSKMASVDHFIPKDKGGEPFNTDNFVMSCSKCNGKKGNKIYDIETLKFAPKEIIEKVKKYLRNDNYFIY